MAWKQISQPYSKYVYADPNEQYAPTPSDAYNPALDNALDFSSWPTAGAAGPGGGGGGMAPIDYRAMIEADPFYNQAKADMSAQGISDAASRAAAIKRTLIDWGVLPDFAAAAKNMGLSGQALGFINSDLDQRSKELAAENEAQGLSRHARLEKANTDSISAIRNALAARGMYQSGELGYGLTENAQNYKQASTDAEKQVLGQLEEVSGRFVQAERDRQRQLAEAMMAAAQRAAMSAGSGYMTGGGGAGGTGPQVSMTGNPNPGPGQIGWDPNTRTPSAGQGLPPGSYLVNGEMWTYNPQTGWTRGAAGPTGSDGSVPYYSPRPRGAV